MNRRGFWNLDFGILVPVCVLLIISLATLFSLNISFFQSQIFFLVIAVAGFLFFSQVNYKVLLLYKTPIYIISLVLLAIVLVLGIESRGAVRWIEIVGFRIQFSEVLKPFLAVSLAAFLTERKNTSFKTFVQAFAFVLPVVFLIFLQPDLGDALIYFIVALCVLIIFGFNLKYFLASIFPVIIAFPLFWHFLHDYQRQRVLTFFDPGRDPLGNSYNSIQSIIAVGSGMIVGKGFGQGTQSGLRFLPERNTDFIFATISEQLGFIGTAIMLICFVFILYRIYVIFRDSNDKFCKIFSGTVFFIFLIQIFVNIGMNIGILPIVGVTLPFVSSGGSSLLSNFIILGLLSAVNRSLKREDVLEIK